jgi:DNA-binding SARP family transcriptional activator/tetratricopeptide (TPR) repeat protein
MALPPSRKVRAVLAYLALAPRPVPRTRLCDLLWDVANDPRSELRWCLAKLRPLIDAAGQPRLIADRDRIGINTAALDIDAIRFSGAIEGALAGSSVDELQALVAMIEGELLEGLTVDRSPQFDNWLAGQRHRFAQWHAKALARIAELLPGDCEEVLDVLRRRVALMPHDGQAHVALVKALARQSRRPEAERQLTSALKMFAREGLDPAPLKSAFATSPAVAARVAAVGVSQPQEAPQPRRASILVMPFAVSVPPDAELADGLTHDVIVGLAKLRSLMVIARATAFELRNRGLVARAAGTVLGTDYVASGTLRRDGPRLLVHIELSDPQGEQIVWTDECSCPAEEALAVLGTITTRIVACLDAEVQLAERNRALLRPPASLNAWQAYHRGLWHMYRFTGAENSTAQSYFARAVALDPTFSRAHAALSWTHSQNTFLLPGCDKRREVDCALEAAGHALMADPLDPAGHWAMGRALFLREEDAGSLRELDEAVRLSPNFAQGHYALAYVHARTGDARSAIVAADTSCQLSPFDPMLFAFYSARSLGLLRLGQWEEAADCARQVIQQPNVHAPARGVAALTLAATGRLDEARAQIAIIRRERPNYDMAQFFSVFRMRNDMQRTFREAAKLIGLN